ncbi:hypothetical protein BV898_19714 [Hypsibius exemplaris]|uniref:Uncharacterized protein n=1 Tax=Hypsibius exemplaris TaxID=2072580 RepID=A0A9X6NJS3_HYPEX|nr:hypothetical protein BV898_19714 [Hypsibius exemplaris]
MRTPYNPSHSAFETGCRGMQSLTTAMNILCSLWLWVSASPPSPTYSVGADAFCDIPDRTSLLLDVRIPQVPGATPVIVFRTHRLSSRLLKACHYGRRSLTVWELRVSENAVYI